MPQPEPLEPRELSDAELFALVGPWGEGARTAHAELHRRHARRVRLIVTSVLSRAYREQAEDVEQTVWRKLLEGRSERVRDLGWLVRTARNAAIDARRSLERRRRHESATRDEVFEREAEQESPLGSLLAQERRERLRQCLEQLDAAGRTVILLRGEGLLWKEIAVRLGLALATVQGRFQNLLERLRRCVEGRLR